MIRQKGYLFFLFLAWLAAACNAPDAVNVRPHQLFSEHAVLQRGSGIAIWGTAEPGGNLEVVLAGSRQITQVDDSGRWEVNFPEMEAGGPHELRIEGGDTTIAYQNVMIGDVWLASGQSNMEWAMEWGIDNEEEEIANADFPAIRTFKVAHDVSIQPREQLPEGQWEEVNPENIADFSAVAYFFGREIHQEVGVPIGLIQSTWGGTPAEAWTSPEALAQMSSFDERLQQLAQLPEDLNFRKLQSQAEAAEKAAEDRISAEGFTPDFDTESWPQMELPGYLELSADSSLSDFDGYVWFSKTFSVPAAQADQPMSLHLGTIDDRDVTWLNGQQVGATSSYNAERVYEISAELIRAGENTLMVRVQDTGGQGGFSGTADEMYLAAREGNYRLSLAGNWRYNADIEERFTPASGYSREPAMLYNAMIHPLIPYKIKGVIWYQGESNAGRAREYQTLFPLMIEDWRNRWDIGDFPFLFVQLANFKPGPPLDFDDWAELREAQLMALDLDNTAMAVSIDIGDSLDIHPRNKQDVGLRLARAALKEAYGRENVWLGPLYESMRVQGDSAVISFSEVGDGLMVVPGEKLRGFSIAGNDQRFYPAEARIISENEVAVSNPRVEEPQAVRYGWSNNPDVNLYNESFMPASPFRTDDWTGDEGTESGI